MRERTTTYKHEQKHYNRKRRLNYKANGCCPSCGKPNTGRFASCDECLARRRRSLKRLLKKSVCCCKDRAPLVNNTSCEKCWFKKKAVVHLGSKTQWEELKAIFERQRYRCALTGDALVVGVNASVDHITPPIKGGREFDVRNLQALTLDANHFKWTKTDQEVIEMCRKILKHRGEL